MFGFVDTGFGFGCGALQNTAFLMGHCMIGSVVCFSVAYNMKGIACLCWSFGPAVEFGEVTIHE